MKLKKKDKMQHKVPSRLRITGGDPIQLQAASADDDKPVLRRFTMTAYTGKAMNLAGWNHPVVVDLAGLRFSQKSRPILKDHDASQIVGHTEEINVSEQSLAVTGVISGAGESAQEVVATSDNGFPWQASLGAAADKVVFIGEGKAATANGRKFSGPVYIARRATLGEVSFVALGADDDTSAQMAAGAVNQDLEVTSMEFEQWASDAGIDLEAMDEANTASLKALFEKEQAGLQAGQTPAPNEPAAPEPEEPEDPVETMRAQAASEARRIAAVRKVCGSDHPDIEAQAIAEGWDETKTELAVLRASRPKAPALGGSTPPVNTRILEAAACLSVGFDDNRLVKEYGEQAMEAAYGMRHIGLRELVAECARLEGMTIPRVFGDGKETIRAGFSTIALPGILENVMNKTLLQAYEATAITAFEVCSIGTVADFKEVSRYRLLGTGGFEKVAPDGELKHGKLGEDN